MLEDIQGKKDVNVAPRKQTEITIKGTATGPFVVVGRNFAPGTNAADIEAAMEPVAGHIVGVHITSYTPYVNAQIVCAEKWGAEALVAQFNGQKVGILPQFIRISILITNDSTGGRPNSINRVQRWRQSLLHTYFRKPCSPQ